ncbi:hypothetical protein JDS69_30775, partial [Bacillus cereus]|nr:hypothetical protein [Bacillus cereus]
VSALDLIFGRDLDQLKEVLQKIMGRSSFDVLSQSYSGERLAEVRKAVGAPAVESLKAQEDTVADTTMLSGLSEVQQ